MTKVIVSGANGFVGGALTRELIANGIKVVALDMEGHNNNLPVLCADIPLDIYCHAN